MNIAHLHQQVDRLFAVRLVHEDVKLVHYAERALRSIPQSAEHSEGRV